MSNKTEAVEVFRQFAWHLAGTLAQRKGGTGKPGGSAKPAGAR